MKDLLNFGNGIILGITLLSFLLMFVIEGTLIWLLLRRKKSETEEADETKRLNEQTTKELDTPQPLSLPDPVSSVTEQTTRSFEPIYSERKSR
jgi:type III secretory pathway component EscV